MNSRHSFYLLIFIIIGVIAGLLVGWYWGAAATGVAWLGKLFLNTLSMLVIPLLVSAVITGVTSLGDVRQLGRLSGITISYYLITVAIAVLIGLIMVNIIQPGVGVSTVGLAQPDELLIAAQEKGIGDILLSMVAPNLIAAAAETNLLPLILWSVAFGIALASIGDKGKPAARFFESLNEGMMLLVSWVMYFAPIGVFGLIAGMFGAAGSAQAFMEKIAAVGLHVVTVLSGLTIHFIILILIMLFVARQPISYFVGMLRAIVTAFATASSTATLPITIQCAKESNIDERARRFVLPLGSTVNMDGTALYEAAAAMFIAQAYNLQLDLGQQAIIFISATLAAIGAAGIPQAGLVTMIIVLQVVGLPVEGIGLLLAVDWFLDRFRTATNVWGDAVGAAVVHRYLQKHID
ncbi:MAG: dicarboxylate/amino acid:cation symporter [Gammaproteobacteria bacterium]|nr:MAG: dicarboxylate/amino acid:cation symporter [Gammaproteobacteria bacterium]